MNQVSQFHYHFFKTFLSSLSFTPTIYLFVSIHFVKYFTFCLFFSTFVSLTSRSWNPGGFKLNAEYMYTRNQYCWRLLLVFKFKSNPLYTHTHTSKNCRWLWSLDPGSEWVPNSNWRTHIFDALSAPPNPARTNIFVGLGLKRLRNAYIHKNDQIIMARRGRWS